MGRFLIADLVVEFECRFDELASRCEPYRYDGDRKTDFSFFADDASILSLKQRSPGLSVSTCEYLIAGSRFYTGALDRSTVLLHSSAVVLDGECYLFSANCGVGKSTHTALWCREFGAQRAFILNDDKPALKLSDCGVTVYGTPFCGKTHLNVNTSAPLRAIAFLDRSKVNSIEPMQSKTAVWNFLRQTLRSHNKEKMDSTLNLIDGILSTVPVYSFGCNISSDAVHTAYEAMKN